MSRPVRSGLRVALVEDDHARGARRLCVRDLLGEGAGAALDQDGMARDLRPEVPRVATGRRARGRRRREDVVLHRGERLPAHGAEALPRTPVHAEHEVGTADAHRRDAGVGVVVELVVLQVHVVARVLHLLGDVVRGRLVAGLTGVARRMSVGPGVRVGDGLQVVHVRRQIALLDALDELARRVVDTRGALRRCDRTGTRRHGERGNRAQSYHPRSAWLDSAHLASLPSALPRRVEPSRSGARLSSRNPWARHVPKDGVRAGGAGRAPRRSLRSLRPCPATGPARHWPTARRPSLPGSTATAPRRRSARRRRRRASWARPTATRRRRARASPRCRSRPAGR